jgi:hypothetical protein
MSYRKPATLIPTIIGALLILTSALFFMGVKIPFNSPPHLQLVLGFFIVGILPFSIYRSAKKNYPLLGRLQEKIIFEFTEEKIIETGETFNQEMDWSEIYKVLELNAWILVYQNTGSAIILPKTSFGKNLNEFKDLIRSKDIIAMLK